MTAETPKQFVHDRCDSVARFETETNFFELTFFISLVYHVESGIFLIFWISTHDAHFAPRHTTSGYQAKSAQIISQKHFNFIGILPDGEVGSIINKLLR